MGDAGPRQVHRNLPVYDAGVVGIVVSGAANPTLGTLAVVFMGPRVCQSAVHLALFETSKRFLVRFSFFIVQLLCMAWMTVIVFAHTW
jgi:hypothetical protein